MTKKFNLSRILSSTKKKNQTFLFANIYFINIPMLHISYATSENFKNMPPEY